MHNFLKKGYGIRVNTVAEVVVDMQIDLGVERLKNFSRFFNARKRNKGIIGVAAKVDRCLIKISGI